MWLSGQHKRPAEDGEGQVGVITMSGGETAALLDCERRGLQVYAPGGYRWTPKVGQRVLVIQGRGEIPCVVGTRQGVDIPDEVEIKARELTLEGKTVSVEGDTVTVKSAGDGVIEAENVRLEGQVYVKEETLEELITRIVLMILGGM